MPTVFAVHEIRENVSPARRFGEVVYVNRFYIHGDELERRGEDNAIPAGYAVNIARAVEAFNPNSDYLLISGDHLQLLALAVMLSARHGSFRVLRWDRQLADYIPVRLYSGLVPPPEPVLESSHIGDTDHGESRNRPLYVSRETADQIRNLEAPLEQFDYFRRRPRDAT